MSGTWQHPGRVGRGPRVGAGRPVGPMGNGTRPVHDLPDPAGVGAFNRTGGVGSPAFTLQLPPPLQDHGHSGKRNAVVLTLFNWMETDYVKAQLPGVKGEVSRSGVPQPSGRAALQLPGCRQPTCVFWRCPALTGSNYRGSSGLACRRRQWRVHGGARERVPNEQLYANERGVHDRRLLRTVCVSFALYGALRCLGRKTGSSEALIAAPGSGSWRARVVHPARGGGKGGPT